MSRRTLAALAVGWLLGIVTALVTPTLVWQRQSLFWGPELEVAMERGWYVIRNDNSTVWTLERPRIRLP